MKIALINGASVVHVWSLPSGQTELAIRYTLPDGSQISPVHLGWARGGLSIVEVAEFVVPGGKRVTGAPVYTLVSGSVVETCEVEDIPIERPMVRKSTVQARLIATGKMEAAYAALTSNPVYFARWFAPDHPEVYCDDPDALMLLAAIGADAEIIMAVE